MPTPHAHDEPSAADPVRPRRWLVVHQNSELYGADRVLLEVVSALALDALVRVVLPSNGPLVALLRDRGATVDVDPDLFVLRKAMLHPKRLPAALWHALRSTGRLRRIAARADAVYVNTITLPTAVLAARLARRPVTVHVHEAETQSPRIVQKVLLAAVLPAHRIVAISESVAAFVRGGWPRLGAHTIVVRNPVRAPREAFAALPAQRPDRLVVITPGRWSPRKGTDVAIEAVALAREAGVPVDLVLLGSVFAGYEWYERELREQAARRLPDVRFVPFADDPDTEWSRAHVTLVPSRMEPYGLVAAESMVRGRVTVAAAVEGLLEIVTDGRTGFSAPPEPSRMAGVLEQIWRDWPQARTRAEAGHRAAGDWTEQAFAANLRRVLGIATPGE